MREWTTLGPAMTAIVAVVATAGLAGCATPLKDERMKPGVTSGAEVQQYYGAPTREWPEADGGRTLEYPRQPEGWTNYVIEIGADGRMSALRQQLTPANFAKVQTGMVQEEVRQLLGKPARIWRFPTRPDEEVWDWRYEEAQAKRVFSATFDRDRRVSATGSAEDPRTQDYGR